MSARLSGWGPSMIDLNERDTWVFDLDNTLYPAECDLFAQIDVKMTDFVADFLNLERSEARAVQKQYYAEHGTTLNGLMTLHDMDPADFLSHVHEIDLSPIPAMPQLADRIQALPGQKFIYTNGSKRHAERVSDHMGLSHLFDGSFGIEDSAYIPKPAPVAYDRFCNHFDIAPHRSVFFEDLARNLIPAHQMGFKTVLVQSEKDWSHEPESVRPVRSGDDLPAEIDYVTDNLSDFLHSLV